MNAKLIRQIKINAGLESDSEWKKFLYRCLLISLFVHLTAAYFSAGFYHADEHFQIAEFVNYKLGFTPASELPIEFSREMRPWLMPAFFMGLTQVCQYLGVQSPLQWAFTYRLFGALLGWICTVGLSLCCSLWISNLEWRKWAVLALNFLWFVPSLHARHSSENFSGSFFFLGLSLILLASPLNKDHLKRPVSVSNSISLLSGMLLGLAFECRYQVAFMIAGIFLWLIGHAKTSFRTLLILLLGLSLSVGVGAWADHWGYGHWVFAPWNYFEFNIIQNHVSDMDTSPGWDYFRRAFTESWPFLGFLTLVSFPIFWVRYPKHILTWSVFPFFLIHVLIGHKELRFLFPMAHVAGVVLVLSIMPSSMPSPTSLPKGIKLIGTVLASFSLIGLVLQSLVPAWMPIRFYSHLSTLQTHKLSVYYKDDSFFNLGGARLYFYRPKNAQFIPYENADPILKALHDSKEPLWIFSARRIFPKDLSLVQEKCRIEFSTLPNWIENTKFRKDLNERITNWTLFRCQA